MVDPIQSTTMFLMKGTTFILLDFIKQLEVNSIEHNVILYYFIRIIMWLGKYTWKEAISVQNEIDNDELLYSESTK